VTLYLDTSAIAKLYVQEDDSETIISSVSEAGAVCTSVLAYIEIFAMLERRRREKSISPAALKAARQTFESDWASWFGLAIDSDIVHSSARLAEKHGLRGADAIHLASFERVVASSEDDDVRFLCADERLSKAARSIG
jgi:predicted nucleic acid-binding protein